MKKIISLLLLMALLCSLISCGEENREYDENEVKLAAEELIRSSAELNSIFWGEGIGYIADASNSVGYYYPADIFSLYSYGIETIDDLKEKTQKVFSVAYSQNIFSTVLSSLTDGDEIYAFARYYQKFSDAENKEPECIMVYSKALVLLKDEVSYNFDTLEVIGSKKEIVYVTLTVEVRRDENTQMRTLKVGLIEEDNGWRIDTPTYMSYVENNDYEDLQDKK